MSDETDLRLAGYEFQSLRGATLIESSIAVSLQGTKMSCRGIEHCQVREAGRGKKKPFLFHLINDSEEIQEQFQSATVQRH